jgi:3'-phosphoadenosine 5'-phosphosulfate sulfotransferase (PAPS reductase)/FAD synthetase
MDKNKEMNAKSAGTDSPICSSSLRRSGRVISWFSCGAASAVATKLALEKYGTVEIYYTDTGLEHEDNPRFIADCQNWFGREVTILKSTEYKDALEVCEKSRYLSSPQGAPCTGAMKKAPANGIWHLGDVEIFGYTADEQHRLKRWQRDNPERIIECPLIDGLLDKGDCLGMLDRVGIEIPTMYKLGFRNNNCIGCVKARDSVDYWKRVRKHFPVQFERVAKLENELGYAINRITRKGKRIDVPLYELPPGDPTGADPKISCGLFCMTEADSFSQTNSQDQKPL